MRARLIVLPAAVLVTVVAGCHPKPTGSPESRDRGEQPTTAPASTPASAVTEFTQPGLGVRLAYPADWTPAQSDGFALALIPKGAMRQGDAGDDAPTVSLEVPKLPSHVPGFIPLGMVVKGYIDDLKKEYPGVKVDAPAAVQVAGANARRVRATWEAQGKRRSEEAVLTVHGDRVYIFRADAAATDEQRAAAVLDHVLQSVRWE